LLAPGKQALSNREEYVDLRIESIFFEQKNEKVSMSVSIYRLFPWGKWTMKVVPLPSSLLKLTVPPSDSVIRLTTGKPNP
jgi:hypothetical protein